VLNLSLIWKAYYSLTGVQCGPDLCNMNGSLWTLPFEAKCYITLALLGALGLAERKWLVRLIYPMTILVVALWDIEPLHTAISMQVGPKYIDLLDKAVRLWPLFALGTAAYVFKDRIGLSWRVLAGLAAFYLLTAHTPFAIQSRALFVGYAVLCLGLLTAERVKFSGNWHDYSYGMYIYAFPAMMAILLTFGKQPIGLLTLETGALAFPFAFASWHVVEKPVMDWAKSRLRTDTSILVAERAAAE
jgi:peptidoglycan/LPS O-acetylase OafA/YrhL